MTDIKGLVTSWIEGLAARGIVPSVRNGRIFFGPSSAYKSLTDDEVIFLRHHRAEIKAAIEAGFSPTPQLPAGPLVITDADTVEAVRVIDRRRTFDGTTPPEPLPRERWPDYGVYELVGPNGELIPSHRFGDAHARKIIDGDEAAQRSAREDVERLRRDEFNQQNWRLHDLVRWKL